jgi:MFS family permease
MNGRARRKEGLFSDPPFRRYFAARVVSQLGDQMYIFAVGWYVMELTGSSFHLAAILAVNALMTVLVSPFAGLISDRVSRKKVMAVTDLIQGLAVLALLAARPNGLPIGALYAVTVILGTCGAVFSPAAGAIVPSLVGTARLSSAVAAGQAAGNLCIVAGMALGGTFYRLIGVTGVLALNAVSNLVAAGLEARLSSASPAGIGAAGPTAMGAFRRFFADMGEGLRFVGSDGRLFAFLLVNTAFSFVALPIPMVYLPHFFKLELRASPLLAGFAQAGSWIGIVLGSLFAARLLRRRRPERLIGGGLLAISATTLLLLAIFWARTRLATGPLSAICALANLMAGAAGALFVVPVYAYFHERSRDELRGRFWGLEGALRTAATCCGYFAAGIAARSLSLDAIFALTAVLMFSLFLWVALRDGWGEPDAEGSKVTRASA